MLITPHCCNSSSFASVDSEVVYVSAVVLSVMDVVDLLVIIDAVVFIVFREVVIIVDTSPTTSSLPLSECAQPETQHCKTKKIASIHIDVFSYYLLLYVFIILLKPYRDKQILLSDL